ncbi:resuscitation-promoting factor [Streptomyces griseocarneus]|nr:resuscitation-promoting factor [Streptomyces griseocarneus]
MTQAPGSPRAATSGAAEAPPHGLYDPYDPYDPATPYGAYAPYVPYAAEGERYGFTTPVDGPYDPFLPEPREAAPHGGYEPEELPVLTHLHDFQGLDDLLPRQPAGPDPAAPAEDRAEEGADEAPQRTGARRGAGRRKRSGERPDTLRRLIPQALVVAFLAGGTSSFVAADKTVKLDIEGRSRTLHTFADDVDELLADEHLAVGEHDAVTPGHHHGLAAGDEVTVRYGRPVALTLDGRQHQVWTTARTVDGALRELGVRAEGAYLSASRSAPISRHGLDLHVRTERSVTFMADGRERTVRTNAATVREALGAAGISLHGQDTTSVDPDSFPRDGQTISVMRITGTEEVHETPIDFETERHDDATLYKGTEVVAQSGEPGVERTTYALRIVNGVKQKPKKIHSETVREPRTQIVKVGTKPRPTTVGGAEGLNWSGLAQCEAGGRPDAVDPSGTYGGLYQFDTHTWQSLGGSGRPQDAPASEQTLRAKKLYVSRGASPWPVCGRKLHG